MCCNDNKKMDGQTHMMGAPGHPVGFDATPNFMQPGMGFGEDDVLGAIFARMGIPPEGQEPEEEEAYA